LGNKARVDRSGCSWQDRAGRRPVPTTSTTGWIVGIGVTALYVARALEPDG
jgi:hypothetical protein